MRRNIGQHLIERASSGDEEAFSEIYFRLKDSIYGFAYRMTNRSQIAEEITQEVFVFFIEHPKKYDAEKASLFSFLCGIARNKILNHLKKSGTRLEENNFESTHFENLTNNLGDSPFKKLLSKEFSEKLKECVVKLSPFQKEVLLLREMEELSYEEISGITKTSVGTVKGRLYRARRTLAKELAPYLENEETNIYEMYGS